MKKTLLGLALMLGTQAVVAEEIEKNQGWSFGANLAVVNLDSKVAAQEGVDDAAWSIDASAIYTKDHWVTSLGLGYLGYDDNREFTQRVEGDGWFNDGDISTESSDAGAVTGYVATGYEWKFGADQDLTVLAQVGYTHLFSSERSIDYCRNCYSEDIDIDGGVYAKVAATKDMGPITLGVFVQQYLSGDIDNAFGLQLTTQF